jgi:hypothetical protein
MASASASLSSAGAVRSSALPLPLAFSGFENAHVVLGGENFVAVALRGYR